MNSGTTTQPADAHRLSRYQRDTSWVSADPDRLTSWSAEQLLTEWQRASRGMMSALVRRRRKQQPFRIARPAIDTLVTAHTLTDRLLAEQWVTAADALYYGAEPRSVARAMRMTIGELRDGLTVWLDQLVSNGLLSPHRRDVLLAPLHRQLHPIIPAALWVGPPRMTDPQQARSRNGRGRSPRQPAHAREAPLARRDFARGLRMFMENREVGVDPIRRDGHLRTEAIWQSLDTGIDTFGPFTRHSAECHTHFSPRVDAGHVARLDGRSATSVSSGRTDNGTAERIFSRGRPFNCVLLPTRCGH